jgi:hypothetical protein
MCLTARYKDFAQPSFYQGPKYQFLKEAMTYGQNKQ